MKAYPRPTEPFAFWLVRQFLPAEDNQEEDVQPISDREFYISLSMVVITLALYGIIL